MPIQIILWKTMKYWSWSRNQCNTQSGLTMKNYILKYLIFLQKNVKLKKLGACNRAVRSLRLILELCIKNTSKLELDKNE